MEHRKQITLAAIIIPNHPLTMPSPAVREQLNSIVKANPELGAAKLILGNQGRASVASLDESLRNRDRVNYLRRQALGAEGMRGSIGSLFELNSDIPETFFIKVDLKSKDANVISVQSPYMKAILNEQNSGLQTDTVEGVIQDRSYTKGPVDIHITSAYDSILQRWVPVLVSIIFGRTKKHYSSHWLTLFESYENAQTWSGLCLPISRNNIGLVRC